MEIEGFIYTLIALLALAAVHIFSKRLRFLDGPPRSKFLSVAAGISVCYVILRLLPALGTGQESISNEIEAEVILEALGNNLYLLVFFSFIFFYGAEKFALRSKERRAKKEDDSRPAPKVYRVHIATFGFLNILIGYLLPAMMRDNLLALMFFFIAMLLKFVVNDHGLHKLHQDYYDRNGRWILAGAVAFGWMLNLFVENSEITVSLTKAVVAGGALLNVLKEELPAAKESNFTAFAVSGLGFAALMILTSS